MNIDLLISGKIGARRNQSSTTITDLKRQIGTLHDRSIELNTLTHLFGQTEAVQTELEHYKTGDQMPFIGYFTAIQDSALVAAISSGFHSMEDMEDFIFKAFDENVFACSLMDYQTPLGYVKYGVRLNGMIERLEHNAGS